MIKWEGARIGFFMTIVAGLFSRLPLPCQSNPVTPEQTDVAPGQGARKPGGMLTVYGEYQRGSYSGDYYEILATGGVRLRYGSTEIRADKVIVLADRDGFVRLKNKSSQESGLPQRNLPRPLPRRKITDDLLRERLQSFLHSTNQGDSEKSNFSAPLSLIHFLYLEGNVTLVHEGLEMLRASQMSFSVQDDRGVFRDVLLRLRTHRTIGPPITIIVRGDVLTKQGPRLVGRDVSITTCTAGKPHFEINSAEIEIIERGDEFEIRSKGAGFAVSGMTILPLPNAQYFTGSQLQTPIKSLSVSYDSTEQTQVEVDLGWSLNSLGGPLHEFLTGRPASEFRGDVVLGLGYNQKRGVPLDTRLNYGVEGLYRGRTDLFFMSDDGPNRREIRNRDIGNRLGNSLLIDNRERNVARTENRFFLGRETTLDLSAFSASDAAVLPEFYQESYRNAELPESSIHLRSATENRLLTVTGRANANGFSYKDSRELNDHFVEELPVATFDWLSQPLFNFTEDTSLLLTSSTNTGWLKAEPDRTAPVPFAEEVFRFDEEFELAIPFRLGPVAVRSFASSRITYFDSTKKNEEDTRWAFAAGVSAGSRFSRVWKGQGEDGSRTSVRHIVSPIITFANRFKVDGDVEDYHGFDDVDALTERNEIRFELLNRLQTSSQNSAPNELLWLDLAQTFLPNASRDNNGESLGLFEYELILRPSHWIPVPGLRLLTEGEYDWDKKEHRTFNAELSVGPVLNTHIFSDYRTDEAEKGALTYGLSSRLLDRWALVGTNQYDLERRAANHYSLQLQRLDHDWRFRIGISFNMITDDTTFYFDFEPTLGGLIRTRNERLYGRQRHFRQSGFDY